MARAQAQERTPGKVAGILQRLAGMGSVAEALEELDKADREAAEGRRAELLAELAEVRAKVEQTGRALGAEVAQLEGKAGKARKALMEAEAALARARAAKLGAVCALETRVRSLEAELRATAAPAWEAFREELQAEHVRTLNTAPSKRETYVGMDYSGAEARRVYAGSTNAPAIAARARAIVEVLRSLPDLAAQTATDREALARIEELRAGLPQITPPPDPTPGA